MLLVHQSEKKSSIPTTDHHFILLIVWRGHGLVHYPFPVNRLLDSNGRGQLDIIILPSSLSSLSSKILIFWRLLQLFCIVSVYVCIRNRQNSTLSCGLFCGLTDLEQTDRDPVIEKLGALSVVLDRGYWGRGEKWCLIHSVSIPPHFQFFAQNTVICAYIFQIDIRYISIFIFIWRAHFGDTAT